MSELFVFMSLPWLIGVTAMFGGMSWCMFDRPQENAFKPRASEWDLTNNVATGMGATACLVVFMLLWFFFGDLRPTLSSVLSHYVYLLFGIAGYLLIGAGNVAWRWWWWFMPKWDKNYTAFKKSWLETNNIPGNSIPAERVEEYKHYLMNSSYTAGSGVNKRIQLEPEIGAYKTWIINWLVWWPGSIASYALHDIVLDIVNGVYRSIVSTLRRLAYFRMAKHNDELNAK